MFYPSSRFSLFRDFVPDPAGRKDPLPGPPNRFDSGCFVSNSTPHPTVGADVVLVYPRTGTDLGPTVAPPHSVLSIAAPLHHAGYRVTILDQRRNPRWREELAAIVKNGPLCVGISTMTGTQIKFALDAAQVVRDNDRHGIPIIWGGPHPTILPEQTAAHPLVDAVCTGEGEETMLAFVQALENKQSLATVAGILYKDGGKVIRNPERPLLEVETLLPVPWELVNPEDYIHSDLYLKGSPRTLDIGQTSRGCPFNCGFCVSASIRQRRWRAFSVERSLDHIISSVRRFNLTGFWLRDDEFYIKRSRTDEICRGMIREKLNVVWYTSGTRIDIFNKSTDESLRLLEESGATVLKMGAESGNDRILKLMGKGISREDTLRANLRIRHTNLVPAYALMAGFPTETWDEIHQTLDFAFQLKKDNPKAQFESLAIYTPMPGTPLWGLALENGLTPPQSLEEWILWNVEDRDVDGKKSPWYNYRDRMALCNVSTMFTTLNAVRNVVDGMDNRLLRPLMKAAAFMVYTDFNYRLRHRHYHRVPEALILEKVRDLLFRSDVSVIR